MRGVAYEFPVTKLRLRLGFMWEYGPLSVLPCRQKGQLMKRILIALTLTAVAFSQEVSESKKKEPVPHRKADTPIGPTAVEAALQEQIRGLRSEAQGLKAEVEAKKIQLETVKKERDQVKAQADKSKPTPTKK